MSEFLEIGEGDTDAFKRQRRNIMVLSLVLIVAQIPETLHIGITELHTHPPFTIGMLLWIVWGYWLWRYYTAFRDLGNKHFLDKSRSREHTLAVRIGEHRLRHDADLRQRLHEELKKINASSWKHTETYGGTKPTSFRLGLTAYAEGQHVVAIDWRPEINVEGWSRTITRIRAWIFVLFHTSLFSEYVLPFLLAFVAAVFGIDRLIT